MSKFNYFDVNHAISVHDTIIHFSGGKIGMNDVGLLESVIVHVQNDTYYPELTDKLTHLVFSIAMNHAFSDGNKRSSIALGGYFLQINGYEHLVARFFIEMENIVLWVAQKRITKVFLLEVITSLVTTGELTEEIKLKLVKKLEK
jgi:death-on-curing protein